jgi:hypothetical protein
MTGPVDNPSFEDGDGLELTANKPHSRGDMPQSPTAVPIESTHPPDVIASGTDDMPRSGGAPTFFANGVGVSSLPMEVDGALRGLNTV